jgi:hypothetical protein
MDIKLCDFLAAFYPDENESIRFRAFGPKGYPKGKNNPATKPFGTLYATEFTVTRAELRTSKMLRELILKENQYKGMYFIVNAGISEVRRLGLGVLAKVKWDGDGKVEWTQYVEDDDITRFNAFFAEDDNKTIDEQLANLERCPLSPSMIVITRKSVHAYWLCTPGVTPEQWADIQARLIAYFKSDSSIKNPSRVMRLPNLNHIAYDVAAQTVERKRVEVGRFEPDRRFTYEEMAAAFPAVESSSSWQSPAPGSGNYETWDDLGAELRRRMYAHPTAHRQGEKIVLKGVCHDGKGDSALFFNTITGKYHCDNDGCRKEDILRAFGLPEKSSGEWQPMPKVKHNLVRASRITDKAWTEDPIQVDFASRIKAALSRQVESAATVDAQPVEESGLIRDEAPQVPMLATCMDCGNSRKSIAGVCAECRGRRELLESPLICACVNPNRWRHRDGGFKWYCGNCERDRAPLEAVWSFQEEEIYGRSNR